jgi:hypothetical protein
LSSAVSHLPLTNVRLTISHTILANDVTDYVYEHMGIKSYRQVSALFLKIIPTSFLTIMQVFQDNASGFSFVNEFLNLIS